MRARCNLSSQSAVPNPANLSLSGVAALQLFPPIAPQLRSFHEGAIFALNPALIVDRQGALVLFARVMLSGRGKPGVPFVWSCPLGGEALCPGQGRVWRSRPGASSAARTWLGGSVPSSVLLDRATLAPLGELQPLVGLDMQDAWNGAFQLSQETRHRFPHVGLEDARPFLWQVCSCDVHVHQRRMKRLPTNSQS